MKTVAQKEFIEGKTLASVNIYKYTTKENKLRHKTPTAKTFSKNYTKTTFKTRHYQLSPDSLSSITDLDYFDTHIQVNVTINIYRYLILDRESFYHF